MTTERDEIRVAKSLQGLGFPASKQELMEYASVHGVEGRTLRALSSLEDRQYSDKADVTRALPRHEA